MTIDFSDLDHFPEATTETRAEATMHPCISCAGTGTWFPRNAGPFSKGRPCFACNGTGQRKATAEEQRKRKGAARKAKITAQKNLTERRSQLVEQHPGMIEWLRKNSNWNNFAQSLIEQFETSGNLSDNQIAAAKRMIAKTEAKRAEKDAAKTSDVGSVSAIQKLFDNALEAGKTRRALLGAHIVGDEVVGQIKMTPARPPRKDIWVKVDGDFVGGIDAEGKFKPRRDCPDWVAPQLERMAKDPLGEAQLFGRKTGICCCCGRELTDPESVKRGIGPICETNWGL